MYITQKVIPYCPHGEKLHGRICEIIGNAPPIRLGTAQGEILDLQWVVANPEGETIHLRAVELTEYKPPVAATTIKPMFDHGPSMETDTRHLVFIASSELVVCEVTSGISRAAPPDELAAFISAALSAYVRTIPGQEAGRKLNLFKEPTSDAT